MGGIPALTCRNKAVTMVFNSEFPIEKKKRGEVLCRKLKQKD